MNIVRRVLDRLGLSTRRPPPRKDAYSGPRRKAVDENGEAPPPTQARGGNVFPNVTAYSHTGRQYKLYDDLIRGQVVLVNFLSIRGHRDYPVTEHLARVAERLGDRLGRDVTICSITTDPEHDTPARLRELAEQYDAVKPGWHFLTTSTDDVAAVAKRLYKHGAHAGHAAAHPMRMVHYGNGGIGVWGACGVDCDPDLLVERLSWVQPGTQPSGAPRRAGPRRLGDDLAGHNREA